MDADVDSAWVCTQAVVSTDSQSENEQEKINNYGCIVLNDMIDNGRYILKEGDNTIGRHPLNHIYIEHPSVSMNHAVIQCDSDGVVLLDKGSLNKTKLNKKTLRKEVAYFLEENALLMFGEVQADYFMNEESNEFTNDFKSMAPDNTSEHNSTQNDGLFLSKLSNEVNTPKSFRTDIPNAITDVSLVIEKSSTCKIEKGVPKTVTETECAINTLNDIHRELNSSSPSDEYLLEALSQVETKQNNVNSNEIVHNLSNEDTLIMNLTESVSKITREDTPSPVMDLESSILTSNNVTKNQFQSPNKINTEAKREDTPSPVMDLESSILTTNNRPKKLFQSPSKINKELIREDTLSPIMDFGCYNNFENNLDSISAMQSPNEVDKFNNTQVLEIDNNTVEFYTHTSNNKDILFCEAQKVESGEQSIISNKNSLDIHSNDNLSGSNNINLSTNGYNTDKHKIIVNTFEADDDDVFRHFIEDECKSQQHDLTKLENQDFFNCPTQKVSIKKDINSKSKLTYSIHNEETQRLPEFKQLNKTNTITSKNYSTNKHEDLTQILEMDDDFFNCPTQKVSITKNIQPKVTSSIHDKETQSLIDLSTFIKNNASTSKSKREDLTQIPEMDDDFFNCPTQKVSITKRISSKGSSSIHDEKKQKPLDFTQLDKINMITSKTYSTNIHKDLTEVHNKDEDFFNCPTQKLSINKKINQKPNVSSLILDKETQEHLEFTKPCKSNSILSKSYSTSIHEENTQIPKIDEDLTQIPKIDEDLTQIPEMDDDFFNCPTQKLSITKKINQKPKASPSIHEEETQRPLEFTPFNKTNKITSKIYSTSIHDNLTEVPEMDHDFFNYPTQKVSITKKVLPKVISLINDEETQELLEFAKPCKSNSISVRKEAAQKPKIYDDFFNCPTQKVSTTKSINPKPNLSSSIHDDETQTFLEFSKPCKSYSTSICEENTQISKVDDDFFSCPKQKLSTSKNIFPNTKVSSSIHEEETQIPLEFTQLNKTNKITSKTYSTNIHDNLTEVPEMDHDFFNCPTQKVSITKKVRPKVTSSINDEETQENLEFTKPCKSNSILSKSYSTSIHEENTQISKIDDDFFNCPTQKLSITKKINQKPKASPSIHEEETQRPLEFTQFNKTNKITSKIYSTSIHNLTEVPEMDHDFFNCPTQKVLPKVISSINDEETQELLEFAKPCKSNSIVSKSYSISIHEEATQNPKIDDDFNYPTQKVSTTKNINPKSNGSSSIHDEETQVLLEFSKPCKSYSTSICEENTQISKIKDDFFSCPTQKLSTSKKLFPNTKVSPSIHEEETQRPPEFSQFDITNNIASNTYSTNIREDLTEVPEVDDDFFNCPTQKVLITKKVRPKVTSSINDEETQELLEFAKPCKSNSTSICEENTQISKIEDDFFSCPTQKLSTSKKLFPNTKVSSSIHEEETQRPPEFSQFDITNDIASSTNSTNIRGDLINVLKIDNEDFFNCPTQKVSFTKRINPKLNVPSTVHIEETQELLKFHKSIKNIPSSSKSTISKHEDLTQVPEMDDDFFNCPTQKVPSKNNTKFSMDCKIPESIPKMINEAETKDSSIQPISKISLHSNIKQNKGNIVNSTSQKVLTKLQSNCSINLNEDVTKNAEHFDGSNSHKQTVVPDNEDRCKVQKSKFVKSNIISQSNVQLSVMCNENSSNNLRTNKPKIRVREDLHMSYSGDSSNNSTYILNKPNKNTVYNNINTTVPFNKNFDSPGCSKTTTIKKKGLNASLSTKQDHFIDDSDQSQDSISLKYNHHMKQMNESIFSPLNIPDVSANSLLEHHASPITIENNLNALKCEPSTSSNNAFEWKSFWDKKKVQSQVKGKSDKQKSIKIAPEVKENKERYQTRAITRKRKQNGVVESNKKLCNRNNILEPLVENSSEIVVSFSYLKSRNLQEMKQFVEKTGGTVTDEMTQCSVLVTDKIRCSVKILSAIARGCPIVNANWLKHSYTVKMFQDVDDFIIADKDAERKYKFQLKKSLAKAKTKRLLDGYNVLVTPSVKPAPQEMKVIINCAGGNFVLNWAKTQYTKELIVTCDKDRTRWKPAWDNDLAKIIDSDTLVMSIIRQQLTI